MTALSLALTLRRWIVPDEQGHGWMPLVYLGYLGFLFVPIFVLLLPEGMGARAPFRLDATLVSILLFLPMYAAIWRGSPRVQVAAIVGVFVLGCTLFPFNPYANTYVIYAASLAAVPRIPLRWRSALVVSMLAAFVVWMVVLGVPTGLVVLVAAITVLIGGAVFMANHFQIDRERKRAELKLTQDEVRRIAAFAERERIGRDLHDLLGHTLSLIALKSELAGKLATRDAAAARREIDEVARIARDALAQVRTAVSGIRSAALAAELASAKVLLEAEGVALTADIDALSLAPEAESALALVLREAATNIQRHARARNARVSLRAQGDDARLCVEDDGRGGALQPGNGLSGMRERVDALGGQLRFESLTPSGTRVCATLPRRLAA